MTQRPILSICIPTFNRSSYLRLNLEQLRKEITPDIKNHIEIVVSDNCSRDNTSEAVISVVQQGLSVRYVRNTENIGSDRNIAQCFNLAKGRYVLLLSDDDLLSCGTIKWLFSEFHSGSYGVVFLRQYGYDTDAEPEKPGNFGIVKSFTDSGKFLEKVGASITLISSNVINKELLDDIDADQFCGTNLVQVHLVLRAALMARQNLYNGRYMVACKRNNTGGYDFSAIFVKNLCDILDHYQSFGLRQETIRAIENRMLIGYYPFPLWRQIQNKQINLKRARIEFGKRFSGRLLFLIFVAPIIYFPRPMALIFGSLTVALGRIITGDARRGLYFCLNRIHHLLRDSEPLHRC